MSDYFTVKQMADKHPAFNERRIRNLIAKSDENGFDKVIRRVGGSIVLVDSEFVKWVEGTS